MNDVASDVHNELRCDLISKNSLECWLEKKKKEIH